MLSFWFLGLFEVANKFGMSTGAVHNCTRVFIGAVNKLTETYVTSPSAERREDLAEYAWETFGFRGCVGSTDGTTIPLAYAPRIQPWTYWDRHDRYSINLLLACDHERNIISAFFCFIGAASDAYVQPHAYWCRYPGHHFSLLQYLLGHKSMQYTAGVAGPCSTTRSRLVPGQRTGGARVGRTRSPPTYGPGVPSGHGHCAYTGAGAVRCVQPGLAARSCGRRAHAGWRLCLAASAPAWSRHRPPRQVGAPVPDSRSYLLTALGDLSCIIVSCIGWSAAQANSQ